jgi:hypothetical protein
MIKKAIFILIIFCIALSYQAFNYEVLVSRGVVSSVEKNTIKVTGNVNASGLNEGAAIVDNLSRSLDKLATKTCSSPLYVSDVINSKTQYESQSLINLLTYFKENNYNIDNVIKILINTELYAKNEVENASVLFEPPIYLSEKVNKVQLLRKIKQVEQFDDDYRALAEAVKRGELDANMNLSFFYGHPKSIIEFLLENRGVLPDVSVFQTLVNSGVPVRPNTILNALATNVETDILLLMIKHLPDADRNHRWNELFNGGFHYSYTSFAAKHAKVESLQIILTQSLGDSSDTINVLLKDKMQYDQQSKPVDILQLAENNNIFNQKLDMLLQYDIPVDAELLSLYLSSKSILREGQERLLLQKRKNMAQEEFNNIDEKLRSSVITYAKQLHAGKKAWAEFIFSYDPYCKKVPANSHYRLNNLLEKEMLVNSLPTGNETNAESVIEQIQLQGDIYVDWYINNYILPNMVKELTVKADSSNKKFIDAEVTVDANIFLENWSAIEDALSTNSIPLDYVYLTNAYLLERGIQNRVPQHVLFNWSNQGVPIHNSSLDELLGIEKYAEFTMELLQKGKLINKSQKSVIFQAARHKNIRLMELLLKPKFTTKSFNHNIGLTALDWTLLNYNRDMEAQLQLLLSEEAYLSLEQKELLITARAL